MLELQIVHEYWDEKYDNGPGVEKGRFIKERIGTLQLEHSLISISKWEAHYHKPYLDEKTKSAEEMLYYIQCMTVNKNVNPNTYMFLTTKQVEQIKDYINDEHSATTFSEPTAAGRPGKKQVITSELIYYWMFANQISKECEKWPIQRLINLIRIFSIYNAPKDKKSKQAQIRDRQRMLSDRAALNAKRKAQMHTNG